jgi:hypothetical protein
MGNPNIHITPTCRSFFAGGRNGGASKVMDGDPSGEVHLTCWEKVGVRQDKFGDSNMC